jgi:hypothetical protein
MEKSKWEEPKMIEVNALPEALGHCQTGSSEEALACHNGEITSASGIGHLCQVGGCAGPTPGDCVGGNVPGVPCMPGG